MKAIVLSLFAFMCLSSFKVAAQSENSTCHDLDFIVHRIVNALNLEDYDDAKDMINLAVNPDELLGAFKNLAKQDTAYQAIYESAQTSVPIAVLAVTNVFAGLYNHVTDFKPSFEKREIKLEKFTSTETATDATSASYKLQVNILINKKKYNFHVTVTQFEGCCYLLDAAENDLSPGW